MPRTRVQLLLSTGLGLGLAMAAPGCRSVPIRPPSPVAPMPAAMAPRPIAPELPMAAMTVQVGPAEPLPPLYVDLPADKNVQQADTAYIPRMVDVKPATEPVPDTWEVALARARDLAARRSSAEGDGGWELASRLLGRLDDPSAIDSGWGPTLRAFADGHAAPTPITTPEPPAPEVPAFQVAELRLCREVRGFGDYDPIEAGPVAPGESVVLYAEVANLGDREEGGLHRSTLRPRLELYPLAGGEPVWAEDLGPVEDACRRQRRDCFVNARVAIPAGLGPGAYRLRFEAVDAADGARARAEVEVTVGP